MVYYKLILFFSEGIWPAPITNENYQESLQEKTAKQGFEDYHMMYNLGERLWELFYCKKCFGKDFRKC